MQITKTNILAQLQKDILPLQGFKHAAAGGGFDGGLCFMNRAFPNGSFPLAAIHEFFCDEVEDVSASGGFILGIVSAIMNKGGVALWISSSPVIFPPAIKGYDIGQENIIFISPKGEQELKWVVEEALKCEGLAAVITETPELSFTASRRLQLAVEQSRVTGFIIRRRPRSLTTACVTRWRITSLPSVKHYDLPGVGFPCWNVNLLKVRNGTPGSWQIEWDGSFREVVRQVMGREEEKRKTG